MPLSRTSRLFVIHAQKSSSIENYIILVAKHFIWKKKFTSKDLSIGLFQKYLKSKLEDIKNALIVADKEKKFDQWKPQRFVKDNLSRKEREFLTNLRENSETIYMWEDKGPSFVKMKRKQYMVKLSFRKKIFMKR